MSSSPGSRVQILAIQKWFPSPVRVRVAVFFGACSSADTEHRSTEPGVEGSSPSRPVVLMNERSIFLNKQDMLG